MKNPESYNNPSDSEKERRNKIEVLINEVSKDKPTISEFAGKPGFPDGMLKADTRYLERRDEKNMFTEKDDFARTAEPLIAYMLNTPDFISRRNNWAFWSSEYDDNANGTDIVFGVETPKTKAVYSVDVATGTTMQNISNKIYDGFKKQRENLGLGRGHSRIKYCKRDNRYWSENDVPHFVVGACPATINKAIDGICVKDGKVEKIENTRKLKFMLVAEMREELKNIEETDEKTEQMKKYIGASLDNAIVEYFGKERITFDEYKREVNRLATEDVTFRLIMIQARKTYDENKNKNRGVNTMASKTHNEHNHK